VRAILRSDGFATSSRSAPHIIEPTFETQGDTDYAADKVNENPSNTVTAKYVKAL
jgi:hypothetical protein